VLGLDDVQRRFAGAMTTGDGAQIVADLRGGPDAGARLAIHLRHYVTSLAAALTDKFPALAWLVGRAALHGAAVGYARLHPPLQPCIAEYGQGFPQFLARHAQAAQLPYLQSFGELEWAIAQTSIAIDTRPLTWAEVASVNVERIVDSTVQLQPGVRYVRASWRIDELMQTFLTGIPPERFALIEASTLLEIQGARGAFRLTRLDAATFAFRTSLAAHRTVGKAAEAALAVDPAFDAGQSLRGIVDANLVTSHSVHEREVRS
jgi:hypothetical protein